MVLNILYQQVEYCGKPLINVKFLIPFITTSGFQVSHGQGGSGRGFLTAVFLEEVPGHHRT